MKKRITAALLAALLCLLTAAPALAAEPAALTEATGAELEQTIASMLDACITEGLFGPEKQSVTREASFVYRSDESYGAASRTVHDTLRILVNSEDVEQKPYSLDAWKRIVPADHDPILEIRAEGFAPGRRWSYSYLNGGGNLSGLALCDNELWTVSDRDDDQIYRLDTRAPTWSA